MRSYYLLTKPGIVLGNLLTVAAGFALAAGGLSQPLRLLETLLGLGAIIASACIFNNYIDRERDRKMVRTRARGFAEGSVSPLRALLLAFCLGAGGAALLYLYTPPLALWVALFGFLFYVVFYSLGKAKTSYATLIGSVAGAVPPVVGYSAASGRFDGGAFLLFLMLVFWQMPHFFAIAILHLEDYRAAALPVLPLQKGIGATKQQMVCYLAAFIATNLLLTLGGYTGWLYGTLALAMGVVWMALAVRGFWAKEERLWARQMFHWSLVTITVLSLALLL